MLSEADHVVELCPERPTFRHIFSLFGGFSLNHVVEEGFDHKMRFGGVASVCRLLRPPTVGGDSKGVMVAGPKGQVVVVAQRLMALTNGLPEYTARMGSAPETLLGDGHRDHDTRHLDTTFQFERDRVELCGQLREEAPEYCKRSLVLFQLCLL